VLVAGGAGFLGSHLTTVDHGDSDATFNQSFALRGPAATTSAPGTLAQSSLGLLANARLVERANGGFWAVRPDA
jgi:hypothetical protein